MNKCVFNQTEIILHLRALTKNTQTVSSRPTDKQTDQTNLYSEISASGLDTTIITEVLNSKILDNNIIFDIVGSYLLADERHIFTSAADILHKNKFTDFRRSQAKIAAQHPIFTGNTIQVEKRNYFTSVIAIEEFFKNHTEELNEEAEAQLKQLIFNLIEISYLEAKQKKRPLNEIESLEKILGAKKPQLYLKIIETLFHCRQESINSFINMHAADHMVSVFLFGGHPDRTICSAIITGNLHFLKFILEQANNNINRVWRVSNGNDYGSLSMLVGARFACYKFIELMNKFNNFLDVLEKEEAPLENKINAINIIFGRNFFNTLFQAEEIIKCVVLLSIDINKQNLKKIASLTKDAPEREELVDNLLSKSVVESFKESFAKLEELAPLRRRKILAKKYLELMNVKFQLDPLPLEQEFNKQKLSTEEMLSLLYKELKNTINRDSIVSKCCVIL